MIAIQLTQKTYPMRPDYLSQQLVHQTTYYASLLFSEKDIIILFREGVHEGGWVGGWTCVCGGKEGRSRMTTHGLEFVVMRYKLLYNNFGGALLEFCSSVIITS